MIQLTPILASGALRFAFEKATTEGKITIGVLLLVSLASWTVIFNKTRQLMRASKAARQFYAAYRQARDPLELFRKNEEFPGAPAFDVYSIGAEEVNYHLENNPVSVRGVKKISKSSYDTVAVTLERAVGAEGLRLEKGMIVLSTAVAGGPFIGLLGTVWGVMETFSGVARANQASLTAMAPGVAGALIATVIGLLVAIPAMFAYNFMVTSIRAITQELDNFAAEYSTHIEHQHVDNRSLAEEMVGALEESRQKSFNARQS